MSNLRVQGRTSLSAERSSGEGLPRAASAAWRQRFALPPASRDTGNRISLAELRACAETRDSDVVFARAESRVQFASLDAVSRLR